MGSPNGVLDITNTTVRVSKIESDEVIATNTTDSTKARVAGGTGGDIYVDSNWQGSGNTGDIIFREAGSEKARITGSGKFQVEGDQTVQEYPPRGMTGDDTYINGHGVFKIQSSTQYSTSLGRTKVFDKDINSFWHAQNNDVYPSGNYSGTHSITAYNGTVYDGEWISIELPYHIYMSSFSHAPRTTNPERSMEEGTLLGWSQSLGGWEVIKQWTGLTWTSSEALAGTLKSVTVNATKSYNSFVFAITKTQFTPNIAEIKIFGTPAPSSLEDGHLTLGKTLTTPRVSGHPAGAETPRAESLLVHYDTTVDSVASGTTVVDTSGNGINSTMQNGLVYSVSERALVFDGTDDRTYRSSIPNEAGAWVHSVSLWCKSNSGANDDSDTFFFIGEKSTYKSIALEIQSNENIRYYFWGSDADTPTGSFTRGVWHHVVVTYDGGSSTTSKSVYIDGVKQTVTQAAGTTALNATANDEFLLGCQQGGTKPLNGSISNFKIWGGVALTADEVAAEYALGRTGKAINVTDTAVCIGGTVPRAQLDVRGSARFDGRIFHKGVVCCRYINGGDLYVADLTKIAFNGTLFDPDNLWDTTNNYFVAPVNGVYQITSHFLTDNRASYSGDHEIYVNGSAYSPRIRGYATDANLSNHKHGSSSFILPLSAGNTLEVRSVGNQWWYGNNDYAHSTVSIILLYAT